MLISIANTPAGLQASGVIRPCQASLTRVFEMVGNSHQQVRLVKRNDGAKKRRSDGQVGTDGSLTWGNKKRRTALQSGDAAAALLQLGNSGPSTSQPQGQAPALQRTVSSQQARAANNQNVGMGQYSNMPIPLAQPNHYGYPPANGHHFAAYPPQPHVPPVVWGIPVVNGRPYAPPAAQAAPALPVPPGQIPGLPMVNQPTGPSAAQAAPSTPAPSQEEIQRVLKDIEISSLDPRSGNAKFRPLYDKQPDGIFKCHVCGVDKSYAYKSDSGVIKHIRDAHLPPRFVCNICGRKYTRNDQLTTHLKYPGRFHQGLK